MINNMQNFRLVLAVAMQQLPLGSILFWRGWFFVPQVGLAQMLPPLGVVCSSVLQINKQVSVPINHKLETLH